MSSKTSLNANVLPYDFSGGIFGYVFLLCHVEIPSVRKLDAVAVRSTLGSNSLSVFAKAMKSPTTTSEDPSPEPTAVRSDSCDSAEDSLFDPCLRCDRICLNLGLDNVNIPSDARDSLSAGLEFGDASPVVSITSWSTT